MFALVYLDENRRIRIWIEGGSQQEKSPPNGEGPWHSANTEDWYLAFAMDDIDRVRNTLIRAKNRQ